VRERDKPAGLGFYIEAVGLGGLVIAAAVAGIWSLLG
jgi:hypothetical protein